MANQLPGEAPDDPPPYKCQRTAEDGVCLKFYRNAENGLYDIPPSGERVDCTECRYFFS